MSFEQKDWKDRIAEYINRRRITHEDGTSELITVERDEGTISQEGDAFNAENMNEFEERIAKALVPLDSMSAINANTQANQLAGANAVKELAAEKTAYYPGKDFNTEDELLEYATSILTTSLTAFVPISLVNGNANIPMSYSSGYIVTRYDTCSVVLFGYSNSRIRVNSRSKAGSWTGWKEQVFSEDLGKYLLLTGGTVESLTVGKPSEAVSVASRVANSKRNAGLMIDANGNVGIYDFTNSQWIVYSATDGKVYIPHTMYMNGNKMLTTADFSVVNNIVTLTLS